MPLSGETTQFDPTNADPFVIRDPNTMQKVSSEKNTRNTSRCTEMPLPQINDEPRLPLGGLCLDSTPGSAYTRIL